MPDFWKIIIKRVYDNKILRRLFITFCSVIDIKLLIQMITFTIISEGWPFNMGLQLHEAYNTNTNIFLQSSGTAFCCSIQKRLSTYFCLRKTSVESSIHFVLLISIKPILVFMVQMDLQNNIVSPNDMHKSLKASNDWKGVWAFKQSFYFQWSNVCIIMSKFISNLYKSSF